MVIVIVLALVAAVALGVIYATKIKAKAHDLERQAGDSIKSKL